MKVDIREREGVTILEIDGRIIGSDSLTLKQIVDDQIRDAEGGGKVNLLLNMEKVRVMDSLGLGVVVATFTSVQRTGGRVVLLNVGANMRSLIVIAKLMTIFECYDNEDEAVASFQ